MPLKITIDVAIAAIAIYQTAISKKILEMSSVMMHSDKLPCAHVHVRMLYMQLASSGDVIVMISWPNYHNAHVRARCSWCMVHGDSQCNIGTR